MSCSCDNQPTEEFNRDCERRFWLDALSNFSTETFEKQGIYSLYYNLKGLKEHAKLIFWNGALKIGFTIELAFDEGDPGCRRVTVVSKLYRDKPRTYWKVTKYKINSTPKCVYGKAVEVMQSFGKYNRNFNNCQHFVKMFCKEIGMPSPFKLAADKAKFVAKTVTAPFWVAGSFAVGLITGAVGLATSPITIPALLIARKIADEPDHVPHPLWPLASPLLPLATPIGVGMALFDQDKEEIEMKRIVAMSEGIDVKTLYCR